MDFVAHLITIMVDFVAHSHLQITENSSSNFAMLQYNAWNNSYLFDSSTV